MAKSRFTDVNGIRTRVRQDCHRAPQAVLDAVSSIETCGVSGADLVVHARGGLVAASIAQERPDLVKTLGAVDSSSLAPEDPATPTDFYEELEPKLPDGYRDLEGVRLEPVARSWSPAFVTPAYAQQLLEIAALAAGAAARKVIRSIKRDQGYPDVAAARERALGQIDEHGVPVPTPSSCRV